MNYYGIDLGTSNTLAAKLSSLRGKTEIELLDTDAGDTIIPSIVYIADDGQVIVGTGARKKMHEAPDQTFELVKVRMGVDKSLEYRSGGKIIDVSPQQVTGYLLKYVRQLRAHDPIERAIVTVPAEFDDSQRGATQQASEIAGIDLVELMAEPSAAIMYHLYCKYAESGQIEDIVGNGSKTYFVFDFGGGTLDLSLVRIELNDDGTVVPTVLENLGDPSLGGNDIDFMFVREILEYIADDYSTHPFFKAVTAEFKHFEEKRSLRFEADPKVKRFLINLKEQAERLKMDLSTEESGDIAFDHPDFEPIPISREEFEEGVLETYFRDKVLAALDAFRERMEMSALVDEIVMVGGTSCIPFFKNLLETYFGHNNLGDRVIVSDDYDTAVVRGAAIQSALHAGISVAPFGKNLCNNAVAHDIYINHLGSEKLLIPHGTAYPMPPDEAQKQQFRIAHSLQTSIPISIEEDCMRNQQGPNEETRTKIREMKFFHPFFYHNDTVSVEALVDEHGILHFKATHDRTGEAISFEAEQACQLSKAELSNAIRTVGQAKFGEA